MKKGFLAAMMLTLAVVTFGCSSSTSEEESTEGSAEESTEESDEGEAEASTEGESELIAAGSAPVLSIESDIYGTANTLGESSLKAENEIDVEYDANTSAVLTLHFEDGSKVEDSLINSDNAVVTLVDGDGYNINNLTFSGTTLGSDWSDGKLTYKLNTGDITFNDNGYPVDNGGLEWSAIGGNGNGQYRFNLLVSGITYDDEEVAPAVFQANVYIYGREFSSRKSPNGEVKSIEEQGNGAAGYDDLVLPEAEQASLSDAPEASDNPVWTWIGEGDKPIICDYVTDNFYVTWPEGMDASGLETEDVTIMLYSDYGDTYKLTPEEDYTVWAETGETQISVPYVYWAFTPVYTNMELVVDTDKVDGCEASVSQKYDIASVYTHMVQTGGGMERDLTVTTYSFFGVRNLTSWEQVMAGGTYYYYFEEDEEDPEAAEEAEGAEGEAQGGGQGGMGGQNDDGSVTYYYAENADGTPYLTEDQEEAKTYDATGPDEQNYQLINDVVYRTQPAETTKDFEIDGETYTMIKGYNRATTALPAEELEPEAGYIMTDSADWDTHQRWPWLFFNGIGWLEDDAEEEAAEE